MYPSSFVLAVLAKMGRIGLLLILFQAVYLHTSLLASWNASDIFVLAATFFTIEFLTVITFHRNLSYHFPRLLQQGTFDFLLTKPISPLFHAGIQKIDIFDLTASLPVIVLWVYIAYRGFIEVSLVHVLLFGVLLGVALLFVFSLLLLIASTAFWTVTATGVGRLFESVMRAGRFPGDIFQGPVRLIMFYLLPIGLFVTVPANILRGIFDWPHMAYLTVFTLALFVVSLAFWRFALRHYSSASS